MLLSSSYMVLQFRFWEYCLCNQIVFNIIVLQANYSYYGNVYIVNFIIKVISQQLLFSSLESYKSFKR
jgi:hypothetical protein